MRLLILLSAAMLMMACQTTSAPESVRSSISADQKFTELADEAWQFNQRQGGLLAPDARSAGADARLADISPEALAQAHTQRVEYYQAITAIASEQLSEANQINRDMILYALRNQISRYQFNMHLMPLTNETGPHNSIARLGDMMRIESVQDGEAYLALLRDVPTWLGQQTDYMRQGLATGMAQPQVVLSRFAEGVQAYVTMDPTESVFYRPMQRARQHLSSEELAHFEVELQTVIATVVNSAFMDFYDFLTDEYIPNARTDIAAHQLPNGEAFYTNRVKHYTTLDLSPEEIHQIGLEQVALIRAEMETIIEEVGFEGSFAEFIHFLRTDPQFYTDSPEQLLKEAAWIAKQADAALPSLFYRMPRTPYGVAPVPAEIAPNYTQGRYVSPRGDDQPGYYWVNTYAVETRPLYELEALTLHEGVPGHHFQIALAMEMENVPAYRQSTYISAFGEGWGLYAEYLGLEAGFYEDPYSNFGRLTYAMWRAARLVVDTGMHALGWSRDEAVEFLGSNTALSLHNVNTEIDRYISWPGQALSYKLGLLTIQELRAEAEAAHGTHFDLREFHDEVLRNGSVPLATLEQQVRAYISRKAEEIR
ncbi:DUF885 domain-containing protein [Aliidiomarina indica]|uniref:DUF885 domain-containing protein n=1 Tax=Aliidiomarina indica TaxID=2749147 RepID=UPI0018906FC9|nr:DUF885 domain-containing protein [Aliidiomarina indica]